MTDGQRPRRPGSSLGRGRVGAWAVIAAGLLVVLPADVGWAQWTPYPAGPSAPSAPNSGPVSPFQNMFDALQGDDLGRTRGLPHASPVMMASPGSATLEVLFKLNSAAVSSLDAASLKAAAAQAASAKSLRVDIIGHTDSLGNAAANSALALRRARSVAEVLAQAGIPAEAMSIRALGDEQPTQTDGPGVSEPANRRVEIIFH